MLNFVTSLPPSLEPQALYFVGDGTTKAEFYVGNNAGDPVPIATDVIIQALAAVEAQNAVNAIVGAAPATLDTLDELAAALQDNPNVITNLLTSVGTKADATNVYTKAESDTRQTTLQNAINAKQDALSNAAELAKFNNGQYDGKAIVVVGTAEW